MDKGSENTYSPELLRAVRHFRHEQFYFGETLFHPDDIFIASYPRSGSHFLRFIILSALHYRKYHEFPSSFAGMTGIPDVHGNRLDLATKQPRIIKTHYPYDPRYRSIIHLVWDARDLIVSYFFFTSTKKQLFFDSLPKPPTLPEFVELFLQGKVWPGDLRHHTESFWKASEHTRYICIQYERLISDPHAEIARLLDFLAIDLYGKAVDGLIEHTSFVNMSKLHEPQSAREGGMPEKRDQMLRKGTTGAYKQTITADLLELVERYFGISS